MRIFVGGVFAAAAGMLAACSTTPAAPGSAMGATVPVPASSAATVMAATGAGTAGTGLDGVYRAPPDGARGGSACGTTVFRFPVRVVNGIASLQTVSAGLIQGKVAPDGSLAIDEGRSNLHGQFSGNTFNGTYARGSCGFVLNYTK